MRRAFSISLILVFWLGPLAALFPAGSDARLPVCCRRHGAHHCMGLGEQTADKTTSVSTPSRCPAFPTPIPATLGAQLALTATTLATPPPAVRTIGLVRSRSQIRSQVGRTLTDRGPPAGDVA